MDVKIRQEQNADYEIVENLTYLAFKNMEFADGDEHELVAKLRKSKDFIPELSLLAIVDECIVGHILFTRSKIVSSTETFDSLTLAPVSVHPDWQRKGIGSLLIREGIEIAVKLGFDNINLVGHKDYYPRFGFARASLFGISMNMVVPDSAFMVLELIPGSLSGKSGVLHYAKEFGF